jgi:hypothetical protein
VFLALALGLLSSSVAVRIQAQDAPKEEPAQAPARPAAPGDSMPRGPAEIFKRAQQPKPVPPPSAPAQAGGAVPPGHPPVTAQQGQEGSEALQGSEGKQGQPEQPAQNPQGQAAAEGASDRQVPPGHPPVGAGEEQAEQGAAPVGGDPHANQPDAPPLARKPIATAEPNNALPPGTIRVRVIDSVTEQPVGNAKLQLGTMTRENTRNTQDASTAADGEHRFEKLATGDGQAYRVNVIHQGAKYSSTPFRLPVESGYDVLIRQLPTTRDPREVVLYVGATSVEVRDERLKIVQQARLINIGSKTYVFPDDGQLIKLPPGWKAFQAEEVMSDQHLKEEGDQGFKITGSLAPGEVTLTWGFDLPYDTTKVDLSFDLPWVTFAYRVLADAAPGMTLAVDEMPAPELHEDNGRKFWVSEVVKRVGDPPLRKLTIHVSGIPGPGPTRIIALVLAVFVLGGGLWFARKPPPAASKSVALTPETFEQRKAELVAQAAQLQAERARDEIGPEFFAQQMSDLEEQLAALLFERSQSASAKSKAA